jgi:oligopeptide/dipeptide ABC transporter ATP-binding protein
MFSPSTLHSDQALLSIRNAVVAFSSRKGLWGANSGKTIRAVNDVSLDIFRGEMLGLVGESGCGKSTLGRAALQLTPLTSGSVFYEGQNLADRLKSERRSIRRELQMVYQDPYSSLNPRIRIGAALAEAIHVHGRRKGRKAVNDRVMELLEMVGLPHDANNRFPHEFSGGQRQRISIARALAVEPRFIVCDEAVSALDVSIQAQIVELLQRLKNELGLTYLFIAHGLAIVRQIADRVAVMYLGKIVESGPNEAVFRKPKHPYTRALISAIPIPDPTMALTGKDRLLRGDLPNPFDPPKGCAFHQRCPIAQARCCTETPALEYHGRGRLVACWRANEPS